MGHFSDIPIVWVLSHRKKHYVGDFNNNGWDGWPLLLEGNIKSGTLYPALVPLGCYNRSPESEKFSLFFDMMNCKILPVQKVGLLASSVGEAAPGGRFRYMAWSPNSSLKTLHTTLNKRACKRYILPFFFFFYWPAWAFQLCQQNL